jgi:hypothetical protein
MRRKYINDSNILAALYNSPLLSFKLHDHKDRFGMTMTSGLNRRTFDLAYDIEMTQVTMTTSEAISGLHLLQFARSLEIAEVLPYEVRFSSKI